MNLKEDIWRKLEEMDYVGKGFAKKNENTNKIIDIAILETLAEVEKLGVIRDVSSHGKVHSDLIIPLKELEKLKEGVK